MIAIAIITHGHFGEELLRTAQEIVGRQEQVRAFSVSSETSLDHVGKFVEDTLRANDSPDGVIFFVDMLGGTPCNSALLKSKDSVSEIVTGVNLYMLISAFTHRSHLSIHDLAVKVAEDGKRAIVMPKALLAKKVSS